MVVESVNVSVREYKPGRGAWDEPMCWRNVTVDVAFDTGPVQDAGAISTRSTSGNVNPPLARWQGSEPVKGPAPAVEITLAAVVAVYSLSRPGTNPPNDAAEPSVSDS